MFTPFPVTENTILDLSDNRLLLTNLYAEKDVIIRLPRPYTSRVFEILLLSKRKIILHTNSDIYRFLADPPALTLTVGGSSSCVGRSLKIETFNSYWRLVSSSLPDRYIKFEEKPCLDILMTN